MPNVVRLSVLSKSNDVMPRPTLPTKCRSKGGDVMPHLISSDCACIPRKVMSCHPQHYRLCVLSKGSDVMPRPTLPTVCAVQGG